jgi:thioredoxin 1
MGQKQLRFYSPSPKGGQIPMASANIKAVTDNDFESTVLAGGRPAIVDFWAVWCAPCRALAPIIDEVADQYAGKLDVYKLDIDNNPETPARFGVRGIPTVILFKDGQVVDQVVGAVPKHQIESLIKKAL